MVAVCFNASVLYKLCILCKVVGHRVLQSISVQIKHAGLRCRGESYFLNNTFEHRKDGVGGQ